MLMLQFIQFFILCLLIHSLSCLFRSSYSHLPCINPCPFYLFNHLTPPTSLPILHSVTSSLGYLIYHSHAIPAVAFQPFYTHIFAFLISTFSMFLDFAFGPLPCACLMCLPADFLVPHPSPYLQLFALPRVTNES